MTTRNPQALPNTAHSVSVHYNTQVKSFLCYIALIAQRRVVCFGKWYSTMGRDNAVGIATRYGMDGLGIKSQWGGEIFRTRPDRLWGPPSRYRVFPGGKAAGVWR